MKENFFFYNFNKNRHNMLVWRFLFSTYFVFEIKNQSFS